jgi:hypothetical protein
MNRFSDFASEPATLAGDKVRIDDILNIEIEILGYRLNDSKYPKNSEGKCLTIQFRLKGELKIVFTGSIVLTRQMQQYGDKCPFTAKIIKINRYYSLS